MTSLVRAIRSAGRRAFRPLGRVLVPISDDRLEPLRRLLAEQRIDLVLDVGAHDGGYAQQLRGLGYRGRIASFEPLASAFERLAAVAAPDPAWDAHRLALAEASGEADLHVAARATRSSLARTASDPASQALVQTVRTERVMVRTLDEVLPSIRRDARRVWLKVDVQGAEAAVLAGAAASLPTLAAVQLEMAFVARYEGEARFEDVLARMARSGFGLAGLLPGDGRTADGRLVHADGLFVRIGATEGVSGLVGPRGHTPPHSPPETPPAAPPSGAPAPRGSSAAGT